MNDGSTITDSNAPSARQVPSRMVHLDVERYQAYLDEANLSEDQKQEFLAALWSIIVNFVDLGFGVHPVQQACGQLSQADGPAPADGQNLLHSDDQPTEPFERAAIRAGKDLPA